MLSLGFRACPARLTRHYNPDHDYSAIGPSSRFPAIRHGPRPGDAATAPGSPGNGILRERKKGRAQSLSCGNYAYARPLREKPTAAIIAQKEKRRRKLPDG